MQIPETETPLHCLETVYRRLVDRIATADSGEGAFRGIVDGWFYALARDVLEDASLDPADEATLLARTEALMEARLASVTRVAPAFSAMLRAYLCALQVDDSDTADGLIAWLGGQRNAAASFRRSAGVKGDIDHFGATNFLSGLPTMLRDAGYGSLLLVLDEVETLQRMRADTRERGLNARRRGSTKSTPDTFRACTS